MTMAVFLSASVPDPQRKPQYADCDPMAIRDAVIALASETRLRRIPLIFGGHPSITLFLARWARRMENLHHVILYQSRFYEDRFPNEIHLVEGLHLVERVPGDHEVNLTHFRREMLAPYPEIGLGVFIGGMDGLQEELDILRENHPAVVLMPLRELGGQTREIFSGIEPHLMVRDACARYLSPGGRFACVLDHLFLPIR